MSTSPSSPSAPITPGTLYGAGRGIDILIPTLNEAAHIVETIENARKVGNVFVLDSLSKDGTQDMARGAGAHVLEHKFIDYAKQKNWGLENLPFTGEWVFILDADERITPELRDELFRVAAAAGPTDGYYVNRVVLYMGHAVRHTGFIRRGTCASSGAASAGMRIGQYTSTWCATDRLSISRKRCCTFAARC